MSKSLKTILKHALSKCTASTDFSGDMPTVTCQVNEVFSMLSHLHSHESFQMNMLLDLCIVDMLHFGVDEWEGVDATSQGYDRARMPLDDRVDPKMDNRFVVVYHLLSTIHQHRIRVKAVIPDANQLVPSVTGIWCNANWYEREAFDLFGLSFSDHPDLRRILTDYGFVGYPMRKDFPLSGKVEMRYDAMLERCIYEPVTVESRVSVPKVIRDRDQRLEIKD